MADVSVRPARPFDAELVARVQLDTWRIAYAELLPVAALELPLDQVAAVWLNSLESPPSSRHRVLVACERDEVVGFAASIPATDDGLDQADWAELSTLLVIPRWGRRGHGSRLLAASVQAWRRDGATGAVAWAWQQDDSTRTFLAAAGWAPDGLARGLDTGENVQRQVRLHTDLRPDSEQPRSEPG